MSQSYTQILRQDGFEKIQTFLSNGGDINQQDIAKATLLSASSFLGDIEAVKFLVDKGAKLNLQNESGYTALIWSIVNNNPEVSDLLLNLKADLNIKDIHGSTALSWASMYEQTDVAIKLVTAGAEINTSCDLNHTPVLYAASSGNMKLVSFLIQKGATIAAITSSENLSEEVKGLVQEMYNKHKESEFRNEQLQISQSNQKQFVKKSKRPEKKLSIKRRG